MEGNLCDTSSSPGARDHFSFLPEEINQLEVWRSPLGQQVLGVVREGEGDNLVTGELRTSGEEGCGITGHSIIAKKNISSEKYKIADNRSRHVEIIYTCINVYI